MVQIREYTWAEFDKDIVKLSVLVKEIQFKKIYGNPRGGLPVAVALSHKTGIPVTLFTYEAEGVLWVDDIVDSGAQLNKAKKLDHAGYCSLLTRKQNQALCAKVLDSDDWIVFPWENKHKAEEDYRSWLCQ